MKRSEVTEEDLRGAVEATRAYIAYAPAEAYAVDRDDLYENVVDFARHQLALGGRPSEKNSEPLMRVIDSHEDVVVALRAALQYLDAPMKLASQGAKIAEDARAALRKAGY